MVSPLSAMAKEQGKGLQRGASGGGGWVIGDRSKDNSRNEVTALLTNKFCLPTLSEARRLTNTNKQTREKYQKQQEQRRRKKRWPTNNTSKYQQMQCSNFSSQLQWPIVQFALIPGYKINCVNITNVRDGPIPESSPRPRHTDRRADGWMDSDYLVCSAEHRAH